MTGALFEAAVRASVLVLAGLFAGSCLRNRSAAFRHWVLGAAIVSAWATLPLSAAMPPWMRTSLVRTSVPSLPLSASRTQTVPNAPVEVTETISAAARASPTGQPRFSPPRLLRFAWWLWMLGTLVSGGALLLGLARLRRIASAAREVESPIWTTTRDELQRAYGLSSGLRLLQSDHPSLLATWGWRRPTIVLPAPARTWSEERIHIVLAHECAHIARGDWVVQIAAETLRACCWFNPLVWLACRRLRHESERACDDVVLTQGIPAASYAGHLLDLTRRLHPAPRRIAARAHHGPSIWSGRENRRHAEFIDESSSRVVAGPSRHVRGSRHAHAVRGCASRAAILLHAGGHRARSVGPRASGDDAGADQCRDQLEIRGAHQRRGAFRIRGTAACIVHADREPPWILQPQRDAEGERQHHARHPSESRRCPGDHHGDRQERGGVLCRPRGSAATSKPPSASSKS